MDKSGHVSIQGEALGNLGCKSKFHGSAQPCPHRFLRFQPITVVGPGRSTWDRPKQKIIEKTSNPASQQVVGTNDYVLKQYKDQNERIGKIYRFKKVVGPISTEQSIVLLVHTFNAMSPKISQLHKSLPMKNIYR